jgi:hypothetical protein
LSATQPLAALRIDDTLAVGETSPGSLDLDRLTGNWRNPDRGESPPRHAHAGSGGLSRLLVSDRNGELTVRGIGVGTPDPYEWGETDATPYALGIASDVAWGFFCRFDFGFMRTEICTYNKEGILVIVTFNFFDDGSERSDYWSREFFNRTADPDPPPGRSYEGGSLARARDERPAELPGPKPIDLSPLTGSWQIFFPHPTGLTRVEVKPDGDGLRVHAFGSGGEDPPDWGETEARVVAENVGGGLAQGFRATYDHGFQTVELFGYLNRGVLAVDCGTSFSDDSGRAAYLTRALFYRP